DVVLAWGKPRVSFGVAAAEETTGRSSHCMIVTRSRRVSYGVARRASRLRNQEVHEHRLRPPLVHPPTSNLGGRGRTVLGAQRTPAGLRQRLGVAVLNCDEAALPGDVMAGEPGDPIAE